MIRKARVHGSHINCEGWCNINPTLRRVRDAVKVPNQTFLRLQTTASCKMSTHVLHSFDMLTPTCAVRNWKGKNGGVRPTEIQM